MPTYQYRCTTCGHDLEAVQKFTDAALTECPNCGGSLRKVFNPVGVVFKGSGFYRTDSRNGGSNGDGSAEKVGVGEKTKTNGEAKSGTTEPSAPKANGSTSGKQPVGSGASSTGSASST